MTDPTLHEAKLMLCSLCLDGAGGECHTPGCVLWINRAPDLSLRDHPCLLAIAASLSRRRDSEAAIAAARQKAIRDVWRDILDLDPADPGADVKRSEEAAQRLYAQAKVDGFAEATRVALTHVRGCVSSYTGSGRWRWRLDALIKTLEALADRSALAATSAEPVRAPGPGAGRTPPQLAVPDDESALAAVVREPEADHGGSDGVGHIDSIAAAGTTRKAEPVRAAPGEQPRSFPVTDDDLDAPDGAVVDGYERHGDRWERVEPVRAAPDDTARRLLAELIAIIDSPWLTGALQSAWVHGWRVPEDVSRRNGASIEAARAFLASAPPVAAPRTAEQPVCSTCDDTHWMLLGEHGEVPCTRCPVPCQVSRSKPGGAFCERTPCDCVCHASLAAERGG